MRRSILPFLCLPALVACENHAGAISSDAPLPDAPTADAPRAADAPLPDASQPPDSRAPVPDARCPEHDCFGSYSCHDGHATVSLHAPVPCEYWTGSCPIVSSYTCQEGCLAEISFGYEAYDQYQSHPERLCKESWKQVGSACTVDGDCHPTHASESPDGGVANVYLHCNVDSHACEAAPPVVVADWLARCGPSIDTASPSPGRVTDDTCSEGVCVVGAPLATCRPQGCSRTCDWGDDSMCPAGSVCEPQGFYAGMSFCKPGPREDFSALPCQ